MKDECRINKYKNQRAGRKRLIEKNQAKYACGYFYSGSLESPEMVR